MKACLIRKYGNNQVLEYTDKHPVPEIGDHEILVQMVAASVNPIDWKVMQGKARLLLKYSFPLILGNDGAGIVSQVGHAVQGFQPGDAVYFRPGKNRIGTFAEYCAVDASEACLKPANLGFEEAAGIPLAGLTAWQALFEIGQLQAGQKVLIHAGAGGVGSLAIQLARNIGAHVITTCSSRNVELVRSLGADQVIDYTKEDFSAVLQDVDLVFDTIGGPSLPASFQVLKAGGQLINIQNIPTPESVADYDLNPLIRILLGLLNRQTTKLAKKHKVNYSYLFMKPSAEQLHQLKNLIEGGQLKPVVDRVFPFPQIADAFAYQQTGRARGKIIIKL
ncbi:MAG: NADP-dependent oxidoreductase [Leptospiraceae bacterium]|nr:NADP-dependent oxidoreductase [Leptospiraceae bacterium]